VSIHPGEVARALWTPLVCLVRGHSWYDYASGSILRRLCRRCLKDTAR
jgi:hypothetical protein